MAPGFHVMGMPHRIALISLLISISFVLLGCIQKQRTYSADPVYARIVDADTGKPIKGVAVVAYWELHKGSITGDGMPCAAANVQESVTDKDGWFRFPGWGPIKGYCGVMRNMNPMVFMFKPGYEYKRKAGGVGLNQVKHVSVAQVDWNGTTIKLKKYENINYSEIKPKSYYSMYSDLNTSLGMFVIFMPSQCNWKNIPYMIHTLELERRKFSAAVGHPVGGITGDLIYQGQYFQQDEPQCGSPKDFIEGLMK